MVLRRRAFCLRSTFIVVFWRRDRLRAARSWAASSNGSFSESLRLHREVRILGDSEARARSLSDEVFWLRHALEVSKAGKEKLKARLANLRAAGATLSLMAPA